MAIDFPDSPSVDEIYSVGDKSWLWNGTYWEVQGSPTSTFSASDTAPSSPNAGDIWYRSDTSQTLIYYDSTWVEVGHSANIANFLADADADTKIQLEESSDEDTIRFDIAGSEKMALNASSLTVYDSLSVGSGASASSFDASGTGANVLPAGTTAQRPANPAEGAIRYNTTTEEVETYIGGSWVTVKGAFAAAGGTETTYSIYKVHTFTSSGSLTVTSGTKNADYIIVAGGGGGGADGGGGGGGGGVLTGTATLSTGTYPIVVGAGGTQGTGNGVAGTNGGDSSFNSQTAIGGGQGGSWNRLLADDGGSGGGAGAQDGANIGLGTAGQGNNGGTGGSGTSYGSGGGGGAGAVGGNGSGNTPGAGGAGEANDYLDGTTDYYAGGGGGAARTAVWTGPSSGGIGGGGRGGLSNTHGEDGSPNTGGGGGGGQENNYNGGNGGSGIVIIRYVL